MSSGFELVDITDLGAGQAAQAAATQARVDALKQTRHGKLPQLVRSGDRAESAAWPTVSVENQASSPLIVSFAGPCARVLTVAPAQSAQAELCAGTYEVSAQLAAPGFVPFVGEGDELEAGQRYTLSFFILRQPKKPR